MLRGVASLLVVFYHLKFGANQRLHFETVTSFFDRGYLWVDFFFILSGFVMSHVYVVNERALTRADLRSYFAARIARIVPLHIFLLLALLVFFMMKSVAQGAVDEHLQPPGLGSLLLTVPLLHLWPIVDSMPRWNIPSWSISAEMHAYLLFPAIVWCLSKAAALTNFAILTAACAFYLLIGFQAGSLDLTSGTALLRCFAGFLLGILCFNYRRYLAALDSLQLSLVQVGAAMALCLVLAFEVPDVLFIPPALLLVAATATDRGAVCSLLIGRAGMRLGDLSYGIYLVHVPILTVAALIWPKILNIAGLSDPSIIRSLWITLIIAAVLVTAEVLNRYIELPARRAVRAQLSGHHRVLRAAPGS
ncbi:acyltransferase [Sphingomonas lutea]|uniref:Acyltransferase n=1 Tax=Sphingomonas lutea TaxID=1045317 RepID=A0A7G9SH12_9SPHN|nr:acyltransferase [Sphingomonas lutea]QNN67137.1 acyltransferase [Sphingomonas lutea]